MYYTFAVAILCLPFFVVPNISMLNFNEHPNDAVDQCVVHNELYWKLIAWFYGPLTFVDVYAISLPNQPEPIKQMSNLFLHAINDKLKHKVKFTHIDTSYEPTNVSYSERFSWQGIKFPKRANQHHENTVRRKRDAKPTKSTTDKILMFDSLMFTEDGVFVIVENATILDEYLYGSPRMPFNANRRIFIIVITKPEEQNFGERVNALLKRLWKDYAIADVLLMTPCNNNPEVIYSFFPYKRFVSSNNVIQWGQTERMDLNAFDYNRTDLFNKFTNLNGFPLRISLFHRDPTAVKINEFPKVFVNSYMMRDAWRSDGYGGVAGFMLVDVAKRLNFTTVNVPLIGKIDFGFKTHNGTFVGSLDSVLRSNVQVSFNGRFLIDYKTKDIEYSFPSHFDKLCIIAPKALRIPKWKIMYKCFQWQTWLFICLVIFLCGTIWFLLKRSNIRSMGLTKRAMEQEKRKSINLFRNVFIDTWIMMLSGAIKNLPKRCMERIFVVFCLLFGLVLVGAFQGILTGLFSSEPYDKDIDTLEKLDETGLWIGTTSESIGNIFKGEYSSSLVKSLESKFKILNKTNISTIDRTAYERDICSIERCTDVTVNIAKRFQETDGNTMLHVVEECPRSNYITYIVRRGSPLLHSIDNLVRYTFEAGILNLWYQHVEYAILTNLRFHRGTETKEARPFSMEDLQTAFYILFFGLFCSTLVFLGEIMVHKRRQPKPFPFVH